MSQTFAVCESCQKINRVRLNQGKNPICGHCKNELKVNGAVVEASDSSLPILIQKSPVPVIVDIWAPWCGPCRSFAPTFKNVAEKYSEKFVFAKINSDEHQRFSQNLGVRGIPTLVVFKNGQEIARQAGAMPAEHFVHWLQQFGS